MIIIVFFGSFNLRMENIIPMFMYITLRGIKTLKLHMRLYHTLELIYFLTTISQQYKA